jgi:hypothetical protein
VRILWDHGADFAAVLQMGVRRKRLSLLYERRSARFLFSAPT